MDTRINSVPVFLIRLLGGCIWLDRPYWRFALLQLKHYGFLSMLHEARTDFSTVLGLIFLLVTGGGALSVDAFRKPAPNSRGLS